MIATNELVVRLFDPATDSLPPELLAEFALIEGTLDPEWIWVLETSEGVVAACIGCPMHGILMLLRIAATENAPPLWPRTLLPALLDDAKARGLRGVFTFLDLTRKEERRLARILARSGGGLEAHAMALGFANFDTLRY